MKRVRSEKRSRIHLYPESDKKKSQKSYVYLRNYCRRVAQHCSTIPAWLWYLPLCSLIVFVVSSKTFHRHDIGMKRRAFPQVVKLISHDLFHVRTLSPPTKAAFSRLIEYPLSLERESIPIKEADSMLTRDSCIILADWQLAYRPSCNIVHETDLSTFHHTSLKIVNNGAFRDVWRVTEFDGTFRAMKTLRYIKKRNFDHRNFDRHRRDAIAFDQLSSSPFVVDIYSHCANSAIFDFSDGGDLYDMFKSNPSTFELLKIAYEIAASLSDAHNFDSKGRPTISHTDVKPDQWILGSDGHYRLSDFNRARFLGWDKELNTTCPFYVGKNGGIWRAPEEYNYKQETNKIDVWSLGNVLYYLVTEERPFNSDKEAIKIVHAGLHPNIEALRKSGMDASKAAIIDAMEMCFVADPSSRPEAHQIVKVLKQALDDQIKLARDDGM